MGWRETKNAGWKKNKVRVGVIIITHLQNANALAWHDGVSALLPRFAATLLHVVREPLLPISGRGIFASGAESPGEMTDRRADNAANRAAPVAILVVAIKAPSE